jgi:galactose mutarotase-like enzyme
VLPTGEQYVLRCAGEEHETPLSEPETANAIHGLVRFEAWQVVDRTSETVRLEHLLHPQPGYPFALRLRVDYELSPAGLRVQTTATNEGDVPLPYGEGHHPYLAAGAGLRVDDCTLVAPGPPGWRPTSGRCRPARSAWTAPTTTCGPAGRSGTCASTTASPTWPGTTTAGRGSG